MKIINKHRAKLSFIEEEGSQRERWSFEDLTQNSWTQMRSRV
jgi:hypothetical protein